MTSKVSTLGWLTSALLSLLTLFVFGSLQNYGPESSVRRFHQAAAELSQPMAEPLVEPAFDSAATQQLWSYVTSMLVDGKASVSVTHYQRKDDRAVILTRYQFPGGEQQSLAWVVNREGKKWTIDTRETALAARYLLDPRGTG